MCGRCLTKFWHFTRLNFSHHPQKLAFLLPKMKHSSPPLKKGTKLNIPFLHTSLANKPNFFVNDPKQKLIKIHLNDVHLITKQSRLN